MKEQEEQASADRDYADADKDKQSTIRDVGIDTGDEQSEQDAAHEKETSPEQTSRAGAKRKRASADRLKGVNSLDRDDKIASKRSKQMSPNSSADSQTDEG